MSRSPVVVQSRRSLLARRPGAIEEKLSSYTSTRSKNEHVLSSVLAIASFPFPGLGLCRNPSSLVQVRSRNKSQTSKGHVEKVLRPALLLTQCRTNRRPPPHNPDFLFFFPPQPPTRKRPQPAFPNEKQSPPIKHTTGGHVLLSVRLPVVPLGVAAVPSSLPPTSRTTAR